MNLETLARRELLQGISNSSRPQMTSARCVRRTWCSSSTADCQKNRRCDGGSPSVGSAAHCGVSRRRHVREWCQHSAMRRVHPDKHARSRRSTSAHFVTSFSGLGCCGCCHLLNRHHVLLDARMKELSRGIVTLNNARKIKDWLTVVLSSKSLCLEWAHPQGHSISVSLCTDACVHAA